MIGPHIAGGISGRESLLKRWKPRVALLLDPSQGEAKRLKQLVPGIFLIGRVFEEDSKVNQRIVDNPENAAAFAADRIRSFAQLSPEIDIWQFNNEVQSDNFEQMALLTRFTKVYIDLLAQSNLRAAIGGFAVGKPPLWGDDGGESWNVFFDAMRHGLQHNAVLLLHAYGQGPRNNDIRGPLFSSREWLLRRFEQQVIEQNRLPADLRNMKYIYGEMGVSKGNAGWKTFYQNNAQAYVQDLIQQSEFLAQQPNCLGACVFTWGGATFHDKDINGEVAERLANHFATVPGAAVQSLEMAMPTTDRKINIAGTLLLDGVPMAGTTVQVVGTKQQLARLRRANLSKSLRGEYVVSAVTNELGQFQIPHLPAGTYRLETKGEGAKPFLNRYEFPTSRTLDIDLQKFEIPSGLEAAHLPSTQRRIECGINIDPRNTQHGNPTTAHLQELKVGWVRFVFKNNDDSKLSESFEEFDRVLNRLGDAGIKTLMILNNESVTGKPDQSQLDDHAAWANYIDRFTERCRQVAQHYGSKVAAFQIWNEPDHPGHPGYEPTVRPAIYGSMLRKSHQAIKSVSNVTVVTAGMAWGDPGWVRSMIASTDNQLFADALCVHPYSRRPAADWPNETWGGLGDVNLLDLMRAYHQTTSKPIWITEFGTDDRNTQVMQNGETLLAHDLFPQQFFEAINQHLSSFIPRAFWFCWSSGMVNNFGVVDSNGGKLGAFGKFREFASLPKAM